MTLKLQFFIVSDVLTINVLPGPATVPPVGGLLSHRGGGTIQWGPQEVDTPEAAAR